MKTVAVKTVRLGSEPAYMLSEFAGEFFKQNVKPHIHDMAQECPEHRDIESFIMDKVLDMVLSMSLKHEFEKFATDNKERLMEKYQFSSPEEFEEVIKDYQPNKYIFLHFVRIWLSDEIKSNGLYEYKPYEIFMTASFSKYLFNKYINASISKMLDNQQETDDLEAQVMEMILYKVLNMNLQEEFLKFAKKEKKYILDYFEHKNLNEIISKYPPVRYMTVAYMSSDVKEALS